jgi:hypothetical protein
MEIFIVRRGRGPGLFVRFWLALTMIFLAANGSQHGVGGTILAWIICFAAFAVLAPDAAITAVAWVGRRLYRGGRWVWWRVQDRYF